MSARQKPSKRDRILDVAERLFAEHGYDGVTIRQIASGAEVDVALASYHFGKKLDLFQAVFGRRAEELKRAYLKLRHLLKPTNKTLVTHIEVPADSTPPKNATNWTTITDPEEVIARLIHRNVKHFGSAHGTPFTVPPLSDTFDWEVQSTQHSNTLHGNPPQSCSTLLSNHHHENTNTSSPTLERINNNKSIPSPPRTLQSSSPSLELQSPILS